MKDRGSETEVEGGVSESPQRSPECARLYTRLGDAGETRVLGGRRVSKTSLVVEALGAIDELNAWLGAAATLVTASGLAEEIRWAQERLIEVGSSLAAYPEESSAPTAQDIQRVEQRIDSWTAEVAPLSSFVPPGGTIASAVLHIARTVCRRAEREVLQFLDVEGAEPVPLVLPYLNRLSDLLFAAARREGWP